MHQCCYKLPIRSTIVLLELIFLRAKMKEVFWHVLALKTVVGLKMDILYES